MPPTVLATISLSDDEMDQSAPVQSKRKPVRAVKDGERQPTKKKRVTVTKNKMNPIQMQNCEVVLAVDSISTPQLNHPDDLRLTSDEE